MGPTPALDHVDGLAFAVGVVAAEEMTRECPDPFPAPTETESQCRKEAPLATNSL